MFRSFIQCNIPVIFETLNALRLCRLIYTYVGYSINRAMLQRAVRKKKTKKWRITMRYQTGKRFIKQMKNV
jgi:hypothetical protein